MTINEMKEKKQQMGYSCIHIAEHSGVPLGTVQKIFSGITRSPRYDTLRALEGFFVQNMAKNGPIIYQIEPEVKHVEKIDGIIYNKEHPSSIHQLLIGEISAQLREYAKENKETFVISDTSLGIQIDYNGETIVYPDLMVVCDRNKIKEYCMYGVPDMVVEVMSERTKKKDSVLKVGKYGSAGVKEYWIVDPDQKKIVVYDFENGGLPVIHSFKDKVQVKIFKEKIEVDFSKIYENLQFLFEKNA